MTTKEVLIKARALIEKGWTKGAGARAESGESVSPGHESARRWCMLGAIAAAEDDHVNRARSSLYAVLGEQGFSGLAGYNDHPDTTHADVLAAFDRAIQECEK